MIYLNRMSTFLLQLHPSTAGGGRTKDGGGNELTFNDLYSYIGPGRPVSVEQANELVNSITVCDPAVGSGHFLVSALNEMIAIKSQLRILCDTEGKAFRNTQVHVENDELIVTYGYEELFEYDVKPELKNGRITRSVKPQTQRIQKALFEEKRKLIENSLFGVDINPNSVRICRLRLWIELLKNAYYTKESGYQKLEVLPNIDINIKQGNSLVSRFGLDADLEQILKEADYTLDDYKQAVANYKETRDPEKKRQLRTLIRDMKNAFKVGLRELHPERIKLKEAEAKLIREQTQQDMFGNDDEHGGSREVRVEELEKKLAKQQEVVDELEAAIFYRQAFEWRFEFPEVLDDEGAFTGFDVVIGNPPYVGVRELDEDIRSYLRENFETSVDQFDLYVNFVELSFHLLKISGQFCFITPDKFLISKYGKGILKFLSENASINSFWDLSRENVFQEASVYPVILNLSKDNRKIELSPTSFFEKEITDKKYGFWIIKIEELDLKKVEYDVWRPLSTGSEILEGNRLVVSNKEISKYDIEPQTDKTTDTHRERDKVNPKILMKKICYNLEAGLDAEGFIPVNTTYCVTSNNIETLKYILALLNSKLLSFYARKIYGRTALSGNYIELRVYQVKNLPIYRADEKVTLSTVTLVDQILAAKEGNPDADTSALEAEIDQLVYELYGLTEEEIGIVEESLE